MYRCSQGSQGQDEPMLDLPGGPRSSMSMPAHSQECGVGIQHNRHNGRGGSIKHMYFSVVLCKAGSVWNTTFSAAKEKHPGGRLSPVGWIRRTLSTRHPHMFLYLCAGMLIM